VAGHSNGCPGCFSKWCGVFVGNHHVAFHSVYVNTTLGTCRSSRSSLTVKSGAVLKVGFTSSYSSVIETVVRHRIDNDLSFIVTGLYAIHILKLISTVLQIEVWFSFFREPTRFSTYFVTLTWFYSESMFNFNSSQEIQILRCAVTVRFLAKTHWYFTLTARSHILLVFIRVCRLLRPNFGKNMIYSYK
jgi:hypothetical protein